MKTSEKGLKVEYRFGRLQENGVVNVLGVKKKLFTKAIECRSLLRNAHKEKVSELFPAVNL